MQDAQSALKLYHDNKIAESFAMMDSLRFAQQDRCQQLDYIIMKTNRYRAYGKSNKAYKYLKYKEPVLNICTENDRYKFMLLKAYLASEVDIMNVINDLLEILENTPNSVSDTSSFGIKRLHLQAKVSKHYGRIEESRRLISKAVNIQLYRKKLTHPESSGFLRTMAYSYLEEGQFEKAREYFRMERKIYEAHRESFPQLLGIMFYNEANTHYEQLEIEEAISDYDSTLFYWAIDPPSKVYQRYAHEALGDLHYEIGNKKLASDFWTKASEIKPPKSNDKTEYLPNPDSISNKSNFDNLTLAYSDALAFRKSIYGNNHVLTGECLTFVGRLNEIQNNRGTALSTYNEALGILIPGFDFRSGHMPLDSLKQIDRYGFDALLGMTRIYFESYYENQDIIYLDSAARISDFAFQALDKVKISFEDSHTALFWSDFTYPLTELSLKIHHTYNSISNSNQNSKLAFHNAESSKSYLLRSILHKDKVLRKGRLPESMKAKEQKITGAMQRLKGSIRMEEKRCGDAQEARIKVWQNELVKVGQEYNAFLGEIARDYPAHFKQLYETLSINTDQFLQDLSKKKTTFISFFYGEKDIYRFNSFEGEIQMKEIPLSNDFKQEFEDLTKQLSNYQSNQGLQSSSSKIYQLLMGDIHIPEGSTLAIIPDGPLYYLPWESLIVSDAQNNNPTYLIEKHPIFYVQSANLLAEYLSTPSKSGNTLLSIIPEYIKPLTFSANDILAQNEYFNIQHLTNSSVTKSSIIEQSGQADIIHFAGHSSINPDNEMMSQLDLGKYEEKPLHSHEIFDMNLDAALVVLSSCHSGSGKYARGEGILNFSQAFQQAGSESVIMSMWNVDDQSTSDLFSKFYSSLESGLSKSAALREAKLSVIKSGDPLISHPYFWASFVLFGDDDPVLVQSFVSKQWIYFLGFGTVLLIGFLFGRRWFEGSR